MKPAIPCRVVCIVLLSLCPRVVQSAEAPEPRVAKTAVIPPGYDELFAAMLGSGAALPAGCALVSGGIDRAVARGVYRCAGDEVVIELRHPSAAPSAVAYTQKIAIVTVRGTPPPPLLTALQERIREREGDFGWVWPEPREEGEVAAQTSARSPESSSRSASSSHSACGLPPSPQEIISPYVPACYPLFVALLVGMAQTLVIILGLGCGLIRLYRNPSSSS